MTKIDIFSGFLGAGKTTLIKKLIEEGYKGEKLVLIENEFGEIGIDGGFLKDAGVSITEMNSGCICCSLVGDFGEALKKVIDEYNPDRILIEPSGVGKLSDVIKAVLNIKSDKISLNSFTAVADVNKCKMYMKNFGEFYNDQISNASCIILSHTQSATDEKIAECVSMLKEKNKKAVIITTPWDDLTGEIIISSMEQKNTLEEEIHKLEHEMHHHHDHDEECECHEHHHHHDHDEECECHEHHHHHDHDEECECHEHHHHEHDESCTCGCHDHDHHHHHADEVFTSWGKETTRKYTISEIEDILKQFIDNEKYGIILRSKGIVQGTDGKWIHFDYIPGEPDVRFGSADIIGRICVIGSKVNEDLLKELFKL